MSLKKLVGRGDRIGLLAMPFVVAGVVLNVLHPSVFRVGGPPAWLTIVAIVMLVPGIIVWAWSVFLIVTRVPRGELITHGPYALVKHPLYTGVAILVLPAVGFLLDTWLGLALGAVLYVGSRIFAPGEEQELARTFGARWEAYVRRVRIPWL